MQNRRRCALWRGGAALPQTKRVYETLSPVHSVITSEDWALPGRICAGELADKRGSDKRSPSPSPRPHGCTLDGCRLCPATVYVFVISKGEDCARRRGQEDQDPGLDEESATERSIQQCDVENHFKIWNCYLQQHYNLVITSQISCSDIMSCNHWFLKGEGRMNVVCIAGVSVFFPHRPQTSAQPTLASSPLRQMTWSWGFQGPFWKVTSGQT